MKDSSAHEELLSEWEIKLAEIEKDKYSDYDLWWLLRLEEID